MGSSKEISECSHLGPVMYYAHTKHRFDALDVEFFEQLAAHDLDVMEVVEAGRELPPPSPPAFSSLFPDMRIAVFRISRVILQLVATPYLVDRERTAVLVVPTMGVLSLSAFKVAAYAFGRGPLALPLPWLNQLTKFGAVLSMPVIPRAAFKISQGTSPEALGSIAPSTPATFLYCYAWKATGALFAAVMSVAPFLPELARHWFYALCLSLSLGSMWDFWCLMAVLCFNIEVAPSFDKPWLSSSFADYWARRWNLTTTYMLRVLIYEPVMEQSLWHMLIFYYATGLLTYHWLAFFSVQAPILTVEAILIKWCKAKQLMLPRPAAIFLTNFLLIVVANPLFFGPCDWSGLCTAMYDNISGRQSSSS
eukprot:gene4246-4496_t